MSGIDSDGYVLFKKNVSSFFLVLFSFFIFTPLVLAEDILSASSLSDENMARRTACRNLEKLDFADATVDKTEYLQGSFLPPGKNPAILRSGKVDRIDNLPGFCRVALTIKPQIKVEVWLPAENWNNRFQAVGNGGFAGLISYDAMALALKQGFATASTDTGHEGLPVDGSFALNADNRPNDNAIEDFTWRAVHEMTVKAKQVINTFYRKPARYAYWNGCSTGGRQGLMEAQRFPDDYNGILAGAPAINWDRFLVAAFWPRLVMQQSGSRISEEKFKRVNDAVIAAYDERDGVKDNVITDPLTLKVDDDVLKKAGLNPDEIAAIRQIWAGPHTPEGKPLWYGLEPGAPFFLAISPFQISTDYMGIWLKNDLQWDWRNLNVQEYIRLFALSRQTFGPVIGTDDPQLSKFKSSGGKLIIWHGLNDQQIVPKGSIEYYRKLQSTMGGGEKTEDFARLFLAPGVEHCRGGAGPDTLQGMDALIKWVEKNDAPQTLIAQKVVDEKVVRERPLCPWPLQSIYQGNGKINQAQHYSCQ